MNSFRPYFYGAETGCSPDPAPLNFLNTTLKEQRDQQQQPSTKQTAPLSALQSLVKAERITIIDPVLSSFPELSEDEEEEPPDPEELRRIQERAKIRELKVRRVHGDPGLYGLSGLALRKPGSEAVFVRRDAEDESVEVDISLDEPAIRQADPSTSTAPSSALDLNMDLDTSATSVASPPPGHSGKMLPPTTTPVRNRRATAKASASRAQTVKKSKSHIKSSAPLVVEESSGKTVRPQVEKKGKPRPETYKQAWSMEEQHLLERLLEEIPDGEKNRCAFSSALHMLAILCRLRWSKISQAMSGRRTARQVASRVQKYYEKLKRFVVDVNAGSSRANDS